MFVSTRRGFLKAAAVGLAAPCAFTQTPQITTTELAPNLFLLSGAGANVLARTGTGLATILSSWWTGDSRKTPPR